MENIPQSETWTNDKQFLIFAFVRAKIGNEMLRPTFVFVHFAPELQFISPIPSQFRPRVSGDLLEGLDDVLGAHKLRAVRSFGHRG